MEVLINGTRYVAAEGDEQEREQLANYIKAFTLEGETFWRNFFVERDSDGKGGSYGMYSEGDELAPFFSEAFLYNLLGKDEARSVLGIMRRLSKLAGVKFDG